MDDNTAARPLQGAPDPANVEEYVRRCLTGEYTEEPEARTYRSDPAFAAVLTPLNSGQFAVAITAGWALLPRFADFDLLYKWIGAAYRSIEQLPQSREVLLAGLAKARRKSLLLTDLGDTEAQLGNLGGAVYWWSQAIHCLSLNSVDCDACLLLSYVADGLGLADLERLLLERFDSTRAGEVRLDPATAWRLANLTQSSKTDSVRRVLEGLQFGYFAFPGKQGNDGEPPAVVPRELTPVPPTAPTVVSRATPGAEQPLQGPPPGWYADPTEPTALCWWDGAQWQPSTSHYPQQVGPSYGFVPRSSGAIAEPAAVVDQTAPVVEEPPPVTEQQAAASSDVPRVTPVAPVVEEPPPAEQQAVASSEVPPVTPAAVTRPETKIQPPSPKQPTRRWPIITGVGVLVVVAIVGVVVVPRLLPANSAATVPASASPPPASSTPGVPVAAAPVLTAGYLHTCRLDAAGVLCWGDNDFGQLGDGTSTDRATPTNVAGLSAGIVGLSAGGYQTCAVTTGGAVKCWGYNARGQLGDGSTTFSPTPVDVVGLGDGVRSVAAGYEHFCVVTTGGAVKCWGANESGQLGDGTTTDRLAPVDVQGLASDAVMVTAGGDYSGGQTCALKTNGSVVCWGSNRSGQLGDGTTTSRSTPTAVTAVASGVQEISAGNEHVCALTVSGEVECWGYNLYGQLGNGSTDDQVTPTPVTGLGAGVRALSSGGRHSCAITSAGGVLCWGDNEYGQLGDGTTETRSTAVPVAGLTADVRIVHAGENSTCVLTGAGVEQCWGDNASGELGNGTMNDSHTPVNVEG